MIAKSIWRIKRRRKRTCGRGNRLVSSVENFTHWSQIKKHKSSAFKSRDERERIYLTRLYSLCVWSKFYFAKSLTFVVFLLWSSYVRITVKFYSIALFCRDSPHLCASICMYTKNSYENTISKHISFSLKKQRQPGKADPTYCGCLHAFRIQTTSYRGHCFFV